MFSLRSIQFLISFKEIWNKFLTHEEETQKSNKLLLKKKKKIKSLLLLTEKKSKYFWNELQSLLILRNRSIHLGLDDIAP